MFGKKRQKRQDDQQQPEPPAPMQPARPGSSSPTPPPPPPQPADHAAAPEPPPAGRPMMSGAYALGAASPDAVDAPEPEPTIDATTQAAAEAERTLHAIEAALGDLAGAHESGDLDDHQRSLADRVASIVTRMTEEQRRFEAVDEQRVNAVGQLQEAQRALSEAVRERDEARSALEHAAGHDDQSQRVGELEHELARLRVSLEHLERERDEARRDLERARQEEHHDHGVHERIGELERELHSVREHAAHAEHERDEARRHAASLEQRAGGAGEREARIGELTEAIGQMERRVAEAEARTAGAEEGVGALTEERDALAALLAQGPGAGGDGAGPDEFCERRRARLRWVRKELMTRQARLYKVKQALEHKARELKDAGEARRQADQYLFEAREKKRLIERTYDAMQGQKARGATGVFLAGLAIAWVCVLGVSWFGVRMAVPVEHNATVGIACDARGLPEPEAAQSSWTAFAMALPEDPMFLERVAQRMKARHYDGLARPSELGTFLAEKAVFESPGEGRVNVTITGAGRDRTQRVLDTLATGIVAYANETRHVRADNAPASVVEPASAEATPVEDPRPAIAAGVAGGLTAVLIALSALLWRSARRSVVESGREALAEIETHVQPAYETPPAAEAGGA